jgi:chromate transporter
MTASSPVEAGSHPAAQDSTSLGELAALFLRLGTTAFGGPAVHIAMMEDEVVRRRRWMSQEAFLDLLGATNLIPGPNSTELAIHIGHARAGWAGLLVAGAAFILPAATLVGAFAWAYVHFGTLPAAGAILYGIKPVVIAVVLQALWRLGRVALKNRWLIALGLAATLAVVLGVNELAVLFLAGVVPVAATTLARRGRGAAASWILLAAPPATAAALPFGLWPMFLLFLKTGAVLFGSGYVLIAFLQADFVDRLGWITQTQLLDAVAVGQVTPGPVFTTATFIGYLLGGPTGAIVATVGIFLPAFLFVALSGPLLPRLRTSAAFRAMLDGVNVASLALMAVVSWQFARAALVDPLAIAVAVTSGVLLFRYRLNSVWLILGGAAIGLLKLVT